MRRAVKGTNVNGSATSGEVDRGAPLAGRQSVEYWCSAEHLTAVTFSDEAQVPPEWECRRCGDVAGLERGAVPPAERLGSPRTPLEFLMMRRTPEDGARLLAEALTELRRRTDGAGRTARGR